MIYLKKILFEKILVENPNSSTGPPNYADVVKDQALLTSFKQWFAEKTGKDLNVLEDKLGRNFASYISKQYEQYKTEWWATQDSSYKPGAATPSVTYQNKVSGSFKTRAQGSGSSAASDYDATVTGSAEFNTFFQNRRQR